MKHQNFREINVYEYMQQINSQFIFLKEAILFYQKYML